MWFYIFWVCYLAAGIAAVFSAVRVTKGYGPVVTVLFVIMSFTLWPLILAIGVAAHGKQGRGTE